MENLGFRDIYTAQKYFWENWFCW